jgi:hypothetical protein
MSGLPALIIGIIVGVALILGVIIVVIVALVKRGQEEGRGGAGQVRRPPTALLDPIGFQLRRVAQSR